MQTISAVQPSRVFRQVRGSDQSDVFLSTTPGCVSHVQTSPAHSPAQYRLNTAGYLTGLNHNEPMLRSISITYSWLLLSYGSKQPQLGNRFLIV